MTNANKIRGDLAERAVRDYLRTHGFPGAEKTRAGYTRDHGDIHPCPGFVVQVKNTGTYRWSEWWLQLAFQVEAANADVGVLVHKLRGVGDAGQWIAAMPLSEYVRLVRDAGYGTPPDPLEAA